MQYNLSDGTTIGYEIHGNGEPLVFLPGILGSTKTYDPIIEKIKATNTCIAIEMVGQGETTFSDNHSQEYFSVEQHTENIIKLLQHLEVKQFNLVGLSYGSVVAVNLANNLSSNIDKIVLLATLLCNKTAHYVNWNKLWSECSYDLDKFTRMGIGLLFSEQFLSAIDGPYEAIHQLYSGMTDSHMEAFRYNLASASDLNIPPIFENLKQNIRFIHGEHDIIHPLHELKSYLEKVGKLEALHVIPKTGHGIHVEAPDIISAKIIEFL